MAKFHNERRDLTGFMLDRWDLHGVPCRCDLCSDDYRELEIMQREHAQRLLARPLSKDSTDEGTARYVRKRQHASRDPETFLAFFTNLGEAIEGVRPSQARTPCSRLNG